MKILNVVSKSSETSSHHFVTFIYNGIVCKGWFTQHYDENIPLKQIILNSFMENQTPEQLDAKIKDSFKY